MIATNPLAFSRFIYSSKVQELAEAIVPKTGYEKLLLTKSKAGARRSGTSMKTSLN